MKENVKEKIEDLVESLENTVKIPTRKYETMAYITILNNKGIDINSILEIVDIKTKDKIKLINEEMEIITSVLNILPEGIIKDRFEGWLVNENDWYI